MLHCLHEDKSNQFTYVPLINLGYQIDPSNKDLKGVGWMQIHESLIKWVIVRLIWALAQSILSVAGEYSLLSRGLPFRHRIHLCI